MTQIPLMYVPHPKQRMLHESAANEILFGGAAGPGKSMALRWEGLRWAMKIKGLQVYLFRRTFPELERNHIIPIRSEFPRETGTWLEQKKRWQFNNGAMMHCCHCQYENDVFQYQGAEIHLLLIDEATSFTQFMYDYLRGRVRCTLPVPKRYRDKIPGIICASNPGGIGHQFVKQRWVNFARPMELKLAPKTEGGMLRQYIPALLTDNPTLQNADPGYENRLDALPEPYRTAYKEGNWNLFFGQAFEFNELEHVIDPIPVPAGAPLYMTFDWGFGKPYSIGWWWEDPDGRLYRFAEDYGCAPGQFDVGLRLPDEEVAERVKGIELGQGLKGRKILRLCDPTCFNKKPDPRGGQAPSTAEVFARAGVVLTPGNPDRVNKIRQFHSRLAKPKDGSRPLLVVYRGCEAFIRTIPLLQADPHNPEDIDTRMEDHCYDEAALICMARPVGGVRYEAGGSGGEAGGVVDVSKWAEG
ncbi:MAG: terminase family protein [Patescibacteria group bacterium]